MLIVVGPPGTGKTYLCAALVLHLSRVESLRYWDERRLLRKIRESIGDSSSGDYLKSLEMCLDDDIVLLDDLGSSGHTEWREEVLFETVDYLYRNETPSVITTNLTEQELRDQYHPRLTSRIFSKENTVVDLENCPDWRA